MGRGKKTGGRQKGAFNKPTFERNVELTKAETITSKIGKSKSAIALVLANVALGPSAKEHLQNLAAMVNAVCTDIYTRAVKYKEDGSPELTAVGALRFEAGALPELAEWTNILLNVLKTLAPYQSATFKAMHVGLTVSAPLGQSREMEAPAESNQLTPSERSTNTIGSSEQASLDANAALDHYRRVIKGSKT